MFQAVLLVLLYLFTTILVLIVGTSVRRAGEQRRRRQKGLNIPPGSMGWPLIGETLAFSKPHPCTSVGPFVEKRTRKYGKVFTSHILGSPAIVSTDPELNQFVLHNDGKLFEANWPKSMIDLFGVTTLLTTSGEMHRTLKLLPINFLGIARLRNQLLGDINRFVMETLSEWKENIPFSFKEEASKVIFHMMVKSILNMNPGESETEHLHMLFTVLMTGLMAIPLNMPGTAYNKAWQSRKGIMEVIKVRMEERRNERRVGTDSIGEDDFLGYVLEHSDLNAEEFSDLIMGLLFAGHETTTTAISMAAYFLQESPKALEQLREENLKIVRRKMQSGEPATLSWEDYKKMDFIHSVVSETLRLGNVARLVFRRALTDVHFKGYDIPCGWSIIPVLSAAHLDKAMYPDPKKFDPWRWQNDSTIATKTDNYLPFGRGMHKCVGGDTAKMMIAVFLHHMVINYNWEPVESDHPFAYTFPKFPKGLPIKVCKLNSSSKAK